MHHGIGIEGIQVPLPTCLIFLNLRYGNLILIGNLDPSSYSYTQQTTVADKRREKRGNWNRTAIANGNIEQDGSRR